MSVCTGVSSDRKVACESTADDPPPPPEDFPPESFWLSKDAEFDWFDQNAFYERNESLKANSNPTHPNPNLVSSSQRYSISVRMKPSFIGLPQTQKTNYIESTKNRKKNCKPANVRLFPKRTGSMGKPAVQLAEPSSPKVSCMGRVKSKRKNRKRGEPVEKYRAGGGQSKGICKQFLSMFRSHRRSEPAITHNEPKPVDFCSRMKVTVRTGSEPESEPEPPGLGGMKRFASGRRSSSSAADVAE